MSCVGGYNGLYIYIYNGSYDCDEVGTDRWLACLECRCSVNTTILTVVSHVCR